MDVSPAAAPDGRAAALPVLYYLRTFYAVARERSFTRGGRRLHLSQPAVSAQIRALERHYGGRLFEVRHRRVELTAEGEALLPYAERVLGLLREAEDVVGATRGLRCGRLVVAASSTIGNYLLPPVLAAFAARHPGILVELLVATTGDVADHVAAERVPFGLVEAPVERVDVVARPFGGDDIVLIAHPADPWARRGRIELDELARVTLLLREPGSRTRGLIERAAEAIGLALHPGLVLGSTEALKEGVRAGLGVAWVPRVTAAHEIASGELAAVDVPGLAIRRTHAVLTSPGRPPSGAARAFLDLLLAGASHVDGLGRAIAPTPPSHHQR